MPPLRNLKTCSADKSPFFRSPISGFWLTSATAQSTSAVVLSCNFLYCRANRRVCWTDHINRDDSGAQTVEPGFVVQPVTPKTLPQNRPADRDCRVRLAPPLPKTQSAPQWSDAPPTRLAWLAHKALG